MEKLSRSESSGSQVSEASVDYSSDDHSGSLINNFETFRMEGGYSDVTISVENREFPCHKVILAAGSPYFKSMFSSGMEESHKKCIDLKQIEPVVFENVLHFIYTGRVHITSIIVQELFRQAHLFQIGNLVDLCVQFFKDNMNESSCLAALTLGDTHAHKPLYDFAKGYACLHFPLISEDEDFNRLSLECLSDLLKDKRLNCFSEDEVFHIAIKWLNYDSYADRRQNFRYKILECIKFPLLSKTFLLDVASKTQHVVEDEKGMELLEDAVSFHTVHSRRPMLPCFQITPRLSYPGYECAVLLGGRLADGLSNEVESFRADTKDFVSLKQLPFRKRNEFAACVIADNIYVSGGLRSSEFWKYDSIFDTWIRGSNMMHARRRHAMAAVDDMIYVLGGFDEENVLSSIEVWTNVDNIWMESGSLMHPVENMGYCAFGKHIYLFGGKNNDEVVTNVVQCFNTATRTTTVLTRSLPAADMCLTAVVMDGQIYVAGLEGVFRYTPSRDTWEVLPDLSCSRDFVSLAVLDQKVFALGGRRRGAKDNLYTDIIEYFDTQKMSWEIIGNIPVAMYSYGCVRITMNKQRLSNASTQNVSDTVME